jgi:hypothetical protein
MQVTLLFKDVPPYLLLIYLLLNGHQLVIMLIETVSLQNHININPNVA